MKECRYFAVGFDPREVVYWSLRTKGMPEKIFKIMMELYALANAMVRTMNGDSKYFRVEVCLHQGLALNPFLFIPHPRRERDIVIVRFVCLFVCLSVSNFMAKQL